MEPTKGAKQFRLRTTFTGRLVLQVRYAYRDSFLGSYYWGRWTDAKLVDIPTSIVTFGD